MTSLRRLADRLLEPRPLGPVATLVRIDHATRRSERGYLLLLEAAAQAERAIVQFQRDAVLFFGHRA